MTLSDLGWSSFFHAQHTDTDAGDLTLARVTDVHRDRAAGLGTGGPLALTLGPDFAAGGLAVGDWVAADDHGLILQVFERKTEIARRAAGTDARRQLIAANVDTLGIVSSCNADFNIARLERYVILASDSGAIPLILLTKADMAEDAEDYRRQAEKLSPLVTALCIDARDPEDIGFIAPWCKAGDTLALVGSSGVGKTTLLNGLTGSSDATQAIREDDAKGRHTTTARALRRTIFGGWIIDTPGMRSLPLTDASDGIGAVFGDIETLITACKFSDCQHDTEPGCAIRAAIDSGELDPKRFERWGKLLEEDNRNTRNIAEARARDKAFGRVVKGAMAAKRNKRGRP